MAEPATAPTQARRVTPPRLFAALLLLGLGLVPLWAHLADEPFLVTLFTRILIFALAAVGLNLVLGFGAMVSFGHAMYLGIGAYAVGILSFHGIDNGWVQLAAALGVGTAVALAVGAIVLRTSGMAFIMITLAFAQMLYFLAVSLRDYGGDDGLPLNGRSDFGLLDLNDNTALYYLAYALLLAVLVVFGRLIDARFGMVLRGCKSNERRMATLGFPTFRYKLSAYVLSALVCVIAGMLMANLTRFIAPSYMAWTVSGELIVMTVLGGLGTLIGPVAGATALLLVEEAFSSLKLGVPWLDDVINQHWLALIGLFIVFVVLVLKQGVYGWLVARERRRDAAAAQAATQAATGGTR
jgi:branched-chain amino acid transport system permease protein